MFNIGGLSIHSGKIRIEGLQEYNYCSKSIDTKLKLVFFFFLFWVGHLVHFLKLVFRLFFSVCLSFTVRALNLENSLTAQHHGKKISEKPLKRATWSGPRNGTVAGNGRDKLPDDSLGTTPFVFMNVFFNSLKTPKHWIVTVLYVFILT